MQEQQQLNTAKIEAVLAQLDQMTYDNRTQSTQIEQLQTTTVNQIRYIDDLQKTIDDQKSQLTTTRSSNRATASS